MDTKIIPVGAGACLVALSSVLIVDGNEIYPIMSMIIGAIAMMCGIFLILIPFDCMKE